jgi:hypothetical protein
MQPDWSVCIAYDEIIPFRANLSVKSNIESSFK